jgi:uncharacterized membrane protein YbjE (DUF340 family)
MRDTFIITAVFILGIVMGIPELLPESIDTGRWSEYALYALLFFVGISIGSDRESIAVLRRMRGWIIFFPIMSIAGSLLFSCFAAILFGSLKLNEVLAVSAGMGYYSLSSIIISKLHGDTLGTVALLSNLSREIITLLLAPIIFKYGGKYGIIAAGGATSMDTTLPVVIKFSGKEMAIISIYSGVVITVLVPLMVTLLL